MALTMLRLWKRLRRNGVLGLNSRNCDYIQLFNPRRLYPLVDDKVRTKEVARKAGVAVPELYAVAEIHRQVQDLAERLAGRSDFVVKPAHGSGGNGILVIAETRDGRYQTVSGRPLERADLEHHVSSIISGAYSLAGQRDAAVVEYRVKFDPIFEPISYQGVPDLRVLVFLGVPVMAMVRLPTRMSDGKANLHQGAIGAGIDIATGKTLTAVCRNEVVERHPDTEEPVSGIEIPGWPDLLDLAARCYEMTGLGYLGVDMVLDRDLGPLLLELNARPGLQIQIANRAGLEPRLKAVLAEHETLDTVESRVEFSRRLGAPLSPASPGG